MENEAFCDISLESIIYGAKNEPIENIVGVLPKVSCWL